MNHFYGTIADLLGYPAEDWLSRLTAGKHGVKTEKPNLLPEFLQFETGVEGFSTHALQELYTRTFDLNPVCTLDAGYHLFGENYKRGLLLANLRETESPYELGQDAQLPDHLPVLLRLIEKLEDAELRDDLIRLVMLPAIDKMTRVLRQTTNPYRHLIGLAAAGLLSEAPDYRPVDAAAHIGPGYAAPELYRISSRAEMKL